MAMYKSRSRLVLEYLHRNGATATPDLEAAMGVGSGGLSGTLVRLEEGGFVLRETPVNNRGRNLWAAIRPTVELRERSPQGHKNNGSLGMLLRVSQERKVTGKAEKGEVLRARLERDVQAWMAAGNTPTVLPSFEAPARPRVGWVREG